MLTRRALLAGTAAAAVPGADSFEFAIIGDRTGRAVPGVYERVWGEIAARKPAFAINVGDTIEGGADASAAAEWAAVRRVWAPGVPMHLVAGNHDIWSTESRREFERAAGRPARSSFTHGGALFVLLDNSQAELLDAAELEFLDRELTAFRGPGPKFVFFHKPFWVVFLKVGSGEFDLHRLARKHHVDFVVSGHGHQYVRQARDGVTYVEVGSSGGSIERGTSAGLGFADGYFYQYATVSVRGPKAAITVRELGPPFGEGRVIS